MGVRREVMSRDIMLDLSDQICVWYYFEIIVDKSAPSEVPVMWAVYSVI